MARACAGRGWRPGAAAHNPGMYLDIPANPNCPEGAMATFRDAGPGRALHAIRLWLDGAWSWCAVAGWDETGPVAAVLTPIEESGDGPACLVTGGPLGLRLTRLAGPDAPAPAWDLADARQWGEPFLICRPEVETA